MILTVCFGAIRSTDSDWRKAGVLEISWYGPVLYNSGLPNRLRRSRLAKLLHAQPY